MTRATRELILSFNGAASPWIGGVSGTIETDMWESFERLVPKLIHGVPEILPEVDPDIQLEDAGALTGVQYLYTSHALGLSLEAQDKLIGLVDSRGARTAGRGHRIRWRNIRDLAEDLASSRRQDNLLGPKVAEELRASILTSLNVRRLLN